MLIKMQGKLGQGDQINQTKIIKLLMADKRTKLCVVVERVGNYKNQDDTAVPLDYPHQVISFWKFIDCDIQELLRDENKYVNSFMDYVFSLEGMIAIDVLELGEYRDYFISKIEKYYFKELKVNKESSVHYIYIDWSI